MPLSSHLIKVVFASGPERLNHLLVDRVASSAPDLPLVVVAEFEPKRGEWIPWHVLRSERDNLASVTAALAGRGIGYAAMVLSPEVPFGKMRAVAKALAPGTLIYFNAELEPVTIPGYRGERVIAALTSPRMQIWMRRLRNPRDAELPVRARLARFRGMVPRRVAPVTPVPEEPLLPEGVTVIIPSRDGKELLATLLPNLVPQVAGEIVISDNGSTDGTAAWIARCWPGIRVIENARPLSFARAVNAGIANARFRHILLLNNDMVVEPGFVDALQMPFHDIPDLFCATAQIFFPPGIRREETGKAVWRREHPSDFPVRCDDPLPGEDLTWVLYGSGGCSLFDTRELRALGGVNELYDPAYVEDMDFGYQAWKRGWPTVFCANARVEHRHRATTSRFYTPEQLDTFTEVNYLKFLCSAIGSPGLFQELWAEAIARLQARSALNVLRQAPMPGLLPPPANGHLSEREILALGNGDVAVFPGRASRRRATILVVSPYPPYPLSHGGAVRMYNLMRLTAADRNQILLVFADELATPPSELLDICRAVVLVKRHGTHYRRDTPRPDTVEEFNSEAFRAALKQAVRQWRPEIVQLEYTQMAQYAPACAPAKTILVEHDITFELQEQLHAANSDDWELKQQLEKWRGFETAAWTQVDCVVTMSVKDQAAIRGAKRVACLPNGVDTERFRPSPLAPEPRRLLFIGSFAHRPNVLALEYFLKDVWPLLGSDYVLHIIAGARHERYPVHAGLNQPNIELEGFVADVRNAYARAEIVIAPLTASAGTNIKVLEAMAMGKLVVTTTAGINGLDLIPECDLIVADSASGMAERILTALREPFERRAREKAMSYEWGEIARMQTALYEEMTASVESAPNDNFPQILASQKELD